MIELSSQYDIVIGSRYTSGGGMSHWGFERFAISRMANTFLKILLRLHESDCTAGFKCYRAEILRRIGLEKIFSPGYSFQVEILYRAHRMNARVLEIPIMFENRHYGESKLNYREVIWFFQTVLKLRWMAWMRRV
jgi:dolichol-phosphate mannosyltransferase